MTATFKTFCDKHCKLTYSPEISGKIIVEKESPILTDPEYHVCYGSVDTLTGKVKFLGCSIQAYDTLEEAKKGLIAFAGYGKPKEPFMPTRKRKGLSSFQLNNSNRFNSAFGNLGQNTSSIDGLEDSLRRKWKI